MKPLLEKLEEDFPFMKRTSDNVMRFTPYQKYGIQCSEGWYAIIKELFQCIKKRYEEDKIQVEDEFILIQVKQKFGRFHVYYDFGDSPSLVDSEDETIRKLRRRDLKMLVRNYKQKSQHICEECGGAESVIRWQLMWIQSLCNDCHLKKLESYYT